MNQTPVIKAILEKLITSNHEIENRYSRSDIDRAIIEVRGVDKRTRDNWFNLLWQLHYLQKEDPVTYSLNLNQIAVLELAVRVPKPFSKNQTRLRKFL